MTLRPTCPLFWTLTPNKHKHMHMESFIFNPILELIYLRPIETNIPQISSVEPLPEILTTLGSPF